MEKPFTEEFLNEIRVKINSGLSAHKVLAILNERAMEWSRESKKPQTLHLPLEIENEIKVLWNKENINNENPRVKCIKLIQNFYRENGVTIYLQKAKNIIDEIVPPKI